MSLGQKALPLVILSLLGGVPVLTRPALGQDKLTEAQDDHSQDVTGILERIRQDVGHYELQAARWRGLLAPKLRDPAAPQPPFTIACQKSVNNYDFDITKVMLTLNVIETNTETGELGLKIPMVGGNFNPAVNKNFASTQTKTIVFDRIPSNSLIELAGFRDGKDYENLTKKHEAYLLSHLVQDEDKPPPPVFPISDTIIALRKSLMAAAGKLPCFDIAKGEKVGDSITLEFQVAKATDQTLGFSLFIVTAKLDEKSNYDRNNTIVISIAPRSLPRTQNSTVLTSSAKPFAQRNHSGLYALRTSGRTSGY